eukprot:3753491-Amphidinium_carterae.1
MALPLLRAAGAAAGTLCYTWICIPTAFTVTSIYVSMAKSVLGWLRKHPRCLRKHPRNGPCRQLLLPIG